MYMESHLCTWSLICVHGVSFVYMESHLCTFVYMESHLCTWSLICVHGVSFVYMESHVCYDYTVSLQCIFIFFVACNSMTTRQSANRAA